MKRPLRSSSYLTLFNILVFGPSFFINLFIPNKIPSILPLSNFAIIGCLILVLGRFGKIRLLAEGETQDNPFWGWVGKLLLVQLAFVLITWGGIAALLHYVPPPDPNLSAGNYYDIALRNLFFHWGLHPWPLFALMGVAMGFFAWRLNKPGFPSSAMTPLFGRFANPKVLKFIDIYASVASFFGIALVFGLASLQLSAIVNALAGLPRPYFMSIEAVVIFALLYGVVMSTFWKQLLRNLSYKQYPIGVPFLIAAVLFAILIFLINVFFQPISWMMGGLSSHPPSIISFFP